VSSKHVVEDGAPGQALLAAEAVHEGRPSAGSWWWLGDAMRDEVALGDEVGDVLGPSRCGGGALVVGGGRCGGSSPVLHSCSCSSPPSMRRLLVVAGAGPAAGFARTNPDQTPQALGAQAHARCTCDGMAFVQANRGRWGTVQCPIVLANRGRGRVLQGPGDAAVPQVPYPTPQVPIAAGPGTRLRTLLSSPASPSFSLALSLSLPRPLSPVPALPTYPVQETGLS